MAEATLPSPHESARWLDRPLVPSWRRLAVIAAHKEQLAYVGLIAVGLVMRVWDLGGRALHHDESLHAYYAWQFFTGQGYSYDPLMHGPLKFELVPLFYLILGVSEFSARLLPALLGTGLIALPFFLRKHLTRPGALLASLMLAISPSFVYFSRFIRDDMILAFFSLALFIAIVRFLETKQGRYLYLMAAVAALAMATMEAAYITFFIFGTFLIFEAVRELAARRDGPVLMALKETSLDTWLTALAIFVVLVVLLYSTFFTNPYGVWDSRHSLFIQAANCSGGGTHLAINPARKDIIGGIGYWQAQQCVQRGSQPWYYYLLVLPLYEQLAVLFGVAGIVWAAFRRSLVHSFLAWWAIMAFAIYSWAGEKMPWLSIHLSLPLVLLAGLFLGSVFMSRHLWKVGAVGLAFIALFALEVHSAFALNYQNGANPTEMLIYVQTSQDVPHVAGEISTLSRRLTGGNKLQIGLDNVDVGGWPFIWYLRDYPNVTETSSFSGPVCGGQYCPVLLMLGPEFDQYSSQLMKHYVAQKYRWNWWFPEDYKQWFPDHVGSIPLAISGQGKVASDPLGTSSDWMHLWNWLIYRQPFGDRGARWLYFLVRRDLIPGSKYYSTKPPTSSVTTVPAVSSSFPTVRSTLKAVASSNLLTGPRGIAANAEGDVYAADPTSHRIVEFSPSGQMLRSWGGAGTAAGEFSQRDSPQGLAVGANGEVYVTDTWNQRIEVFSGTGKFLRQWGGGSIGTAPGQFYGPRSIAVAPSGRVYVADTGNKRIEVFNSAGAFLTAWGTSGGASGQFQEPSSVAVGPSGRVYVADFWNQRIQVFTASGKFLRSWAVLDWSPQSYDEPYLTIDLKTGDVFGSDPAQQRVLAWTSKGKVIGAFGSGRLTVPIGVAAEPNGRVAVSDATADRVDVFAVGKGTR